jgi:glycosyltransferase involved in cell wall biosynthesis
LTLVSNENLKKLVDGRGGRGFVLPDPVPDLSATPQRRDLKGRHQVLLVCTYADDEPYASVIEAARMLEPDVVIYVTGDYRRARHLPAAVPSNVVLTGFLDEDDYVALLRAVQVVVDLTDREDCLVCGAYEGIAAGRPLVLSGSAATRAYFSRGVCYTDNTPADLARQIRFAIDHRDRLEADVAVLKGELDTLFNRRWTSLQDVIGTLGTRVPALDC